jgi:energy-converting hydrogenase Eha subunit F
MSGGMEQVPGTAPEDYGMIDPKGYTGQTADSLYGQPAQNIMGRGDAAHNQWMMNAQDPGSFMSKYLNDFGQLQGAITDATSPLSEQINKTMQQNIQTGTTNLGSQLAGLGGLRSSGMAEMAGRFAGEEAGKAGVQLTQAQLGLLQPLANQQMLGRQYATSEQMKQPMQLMGYQSQFGAPSYGTAQYYQKPGVLDWMTAFLTPGADIAGSMMGGGAGG